MEYNVQDVCEVMNICRASYYKWKDRGKSTRAINREKLLEAVSNANKVHPVLLLMITNKKKVYKKTWKQPNNFKTKPN